METALPPSEKYELIRNNKCKCHLEGGRGSDIPSRAYTHWRGLGCSMGYGDQT